MEPDPYLRQRMLDLLERMATTVLWQDLREAAQERPLRGSLTRGAGPDAPWEFRFQAPVPDLRPGALLRLDGQDQRWRVTAVGARQWDQADLYWSAQVEALDGHGWTPLAEDVENLLGAINTLLDSSTLAKLEADDAREALTRLTALCPEPAAEGHAIRIKSRLGLLRERIAACPQTSNVGRGLILRLEAALRRRGLP